MGSGKKQCGTKNVHFKSDAVKALAEAEFNAITVEDWNKRCQMIIKNEDKYLENEHHIDVITDELIINVNNDSDDSSDEYDNNSDEDDR